MSSPDPLNESGPGPTPLSTASSRRVTRSQASQRTHSFYTSPRKQTFALDVGNEISPQKLIVTVQTEDADDEDARTVNRRLFQSPTPRRATPRKATSKTATKATTTKVPLRGLSDDEMEGATPKRRGRPRKAATPAATQRKRPGTPLARKAIQQSRATRSSTNSVANSDMSADDTQATPRATRTTKRKASSPAKEASSSAARPAKRGRPSPPEKEAPSSATRSVKRGRPRKAAQEPVELPALSDQESAADAEIEDNASVAQTEDNISVAGSRVGQDFAHPGADDMEEDIWLATLSDEATPVARRSYRGVETTMAAGPEQPTPRPQPDAARSEPPPSEPPQSEADSMPEGGYDDYGYMDPQSDVESLVSDGQTRNEPENTVVAEEFTMISVGSLPSMAQLNSSMMGAHPQDVDEEEENEEEELGEATSLIINGALESLRQSLNNRNQDSALDNQSPAAEDPVPPEPAQQQPERPASKPASPQVVKPSPRRPTKAQPLGKQLALKSLQGNAVDSPGRAPRSTLDEHQEPSTYDDSFSEIPEAVLAAATPKRLRKPDVEPENELPRLDIQPSIERPSSVNHSNPQSETNRLLTPDETPSPIPSDDGHGAAPGKSSLRNAVDNEMRSSPPIPLPSPQQQKNIPVIRHTRTRSYETPTEQPSTYISPAMAVLKAHHAHLAPPEHHSRPMLSPIVRAGRALQAVTSDPPSPPGRDSVLRSPFRSPVPRSQSPTQQQTHEPSREPSREVSREPTREPVLESVQESPQEAVPEQTHETTEVIQSPQSARVESARTERSWLAPLSHLKNFVVQGAQALSPRHASVAGMDDPFAPSPSDATRFSLRNSLFGSAGRGSNNADAEPDASSSDRAATLNDEDDEMSWQAEEAPVEEEPPQDFASRQSSIYSGRRSAVQGAAVSRAVEMEEQYEIANEEEAEIGPDEEMAEADNGDYYEDDDIWAFEARRSLPSKGKEAEPQQQPTVSPPRRSKLPSPWRQSSKRLVYKDELHRSSVNKRPQETEDYSLLSQQDRSEKTAPAGQVAATKNVDLSAFFSSPAALPQVEAPSFGLSKALDGKKPDQPVHQKAAPQSLRASVAQRSLPSVIETQQSLRASAARRNQPADIEGDTQQSFGPSTSQRHQGFGNVQPPRQSAFRPQREERQPPSRSFQLGRNLLDVESPFMTAPAPSPERRAAPARQPSPPPSDMSAFSHVPQKMNFTPRTGNASKRLFQGGNKSLFGPSPAAALFGEPASRTNAAQRQREVTPDATTLGPRHRAMSPTKSCMRSPLKGKTPGRVVEFTSSTLSPLQQAQVRAERRSSASPEKQLSSGSSEGSRASSVAENDKENLDEQQHNMAWEPEPESRSQHPQPQEQQHQQPTYPILPPQSTTFTKPPAAPAAASPPRIQKLSQTQWSREHYIRLNDLLQARRQGALSFQLQQARSNPKGGAAARRPDPAVRALLGKEVTAQGESMVLETWHLEVVEAFRAEVGGWDGTVLAKRLFSLLVGEERRRLGLVPRRRG